MQFKNKKSRLVRIKKTIMRNNVPQFIVFKSKVCYECNHNVRKSNSDAIRGATSDQHFVIDPLSIHQSSAFIIKAFNIYLCKCFFIKHDKSEYKIRNSNCECAETSVKTEPYGNRRFILSSQKN